MKEKSMLEKEISMTKFLSLFLGINPAQARHITHEDAKILFPNLLVMTDCEFWANNNYEELVNYVKVKDKNNDTMYYKKIGIKEDYIPDNCCDFEYNSTTEIDYLLIPLCNIDLDSLDKRQLCDLRKKLKKIKKINRKLLDEELDDIQKRLRKLKKEGKK